MFKALSSLKFHGQRLLLGGFVIKKLLKSHSSLEWHLISKWFTTLDESEIWQQTILALFSFHLLLFFYLAKEIQMVDWELLVTLLRVLNCISWGTRVLSMIIQWQIRENPASTLLDAHLREQIHLLHWHELEWAATSWETMERKLISGTRLRKTSL